MSTQRLQTYNHLLGSNSALPTLLVLNLFQRCGASIHITLLILEILSSPNYKLLTVDTGKHSCFNDLSTV